jgi:hypothetical protein
MRWRYVEADATYRFFALFAVRVEASACADPALLELTLSFEHARGSFDALTLDPDDAAAYDTRSPTRDHPLASLSKVIGVPFYARLDPRSGRFSDVRGTSALLEAMAEGLNAEKGDALTSVFRGALNDRFVEQAFDALLHVGPTPDRRLPWGDGRRRGDSLAFFVAESTPRPAVLTPASTFYKPRDDHRFVIQGEVTYARGRPVRAHLVQELVSGTRTLLPAKVLASSALVSLIEWSLEEAPPP